MTLFRLAAKWTRAALAPEGDPRGVTLLILEPTLNCDSSCITCYNLDALNPPAADQISLEEMERLARAVPNLAVLSLGGGEPTLHPRLADVVGLFEEHCRPSVVNVPTNGVVPERIVRCIRDVCSRTAAEVVVHLSIDGVGPLHDAIRRVPGNFEKLRETYARLSALRASAPRLRLSANTCLCPQNADRHEEIARWVAANWPDVEGHSVSAARRPGTPEAALEDGPAFGALAESVRRGLRERAAFRRSWFGPFNRLFWSAYYRLSAEHRAGAPRRWECSAGRGSLYVDGLGRVHSCEMRGAVGRLRGTSLAEVTAGVEAARDRRDVAAKRCSCDHACFMQHSFLTLPRNLGRLAGVAS